MSEPWTGVSVTIESPNNGQGLEVIDPIERRRIPLYTPHEVTPQPADTAPFRFPVEVAVTVTTDAITIPTMEQLFVRDESGTLLTQIKRDTDQSFPAGTYSVELSGLIKIYFHVEGAFEAGIENGLTTIDLQEPTQIQIGARSPHNRPSTSITVTPTPTGVKNAISVFGAALKTTSPERSFPTLRGHPPEVQFGESTAIPDGLVPPTDEIHLEVPLEYEYLYPVAPLSYYLGAELTQGAVPRIVGDSFEWELTEPSFQQATERALKRIFLLDVVTRTEGLYPVELNEREILESRTDLDFASLYDRPLVGRLQRYFKIPYETIADQLPTWKLVGTVEPTATSLETLPYMLDDLAIIRIGTPQPVTMEQFNTVPARGMLRGTGQTDRNFVKVGEQLDAIEQTWVGEGTPIDASKALPQAYQNRIGRSPSAGTIDITVVANSDAMSTEREYVDSTYGSRSDLPFSVSVKNNLTTAELAEVFAQDHDFVHYIGHIDETGFRCADGRLDATELDTVGIDAFFLNACQSYEQGLELVRSGAIGGIVTLSNVVNYGAVRIGRAVARLLNSGFPLRAALEVAEDESVMGSEYVVVGDGGLSVVQPEGGTPQMYHIEDSGDRYRTWIKAFGAEPGMGSMFIPYIGDNESHFLSTSDTPTFTLDKEELTDFLQLEDIPVQFQEQLTWSTELDVDEI